ncbi:hypothetical protein TNIN_40451, partial [Trichonephila inaurata madagascariensis]
MKERRKGLGTIRKEA